jgi:hypothetical protein
VFFQSIQKSIKRSIFLSWAIKLSFAFFFGLLIWYEIFKRENFYELQAIFFAELQKPQRIGWLLATFALLPLNWAAETFKWWHLIRRVAPMSFWSAFRAVLAGVTFSVFTPNRIGEFGGRILFLRRRHVTNGIFSTVVGSVAQQMVLVSFGFVGFVYFLTNLWETETWVVQSVVFVGLVAVSLLFAIFLNIEKFVPLFKKVKFLYKFPKFVKNAAIIRAYTREQMYKTLFWAVVRYCIYGIQYYLILRFFGIDMPVLRGAACIATIYLWQTSVPLPPILGLLARGEIALQVWGLFSENKMSILAATFSLWVINLIIPAFLGLIFIVRANLVRNLELDNSPPNEN